MPRRRKSSGNTVAVDFSGVRGGGIVPEGRYTVSPEMVEVKEGQNAPYINWTLVITEGKHKGQKLWNNTSLSQPALWNLKKFLDCLGYEIDGSSAIDLDLDDIVSQELSVDVEVIHEVYEGKNRPRVEDYHPAEIQEEATADITEADIKKMSVEELEELIVEAKLDIDLEDIKGIRKQRQAVIDALSDDEEEEEGENEEEEEEGENEEEEEEEEETKITRREVKAMDENELDDYVFENEIDLDLDEIKGLKKQQMAVIKALGI